MTDGQKVMRSSYETLGLREYLYCEKVINYLWTSPDKYAISVPPKLLFYFVRQSVVFIIVD